MSDPLTYGELMMLCKGHGTSRIYERHLETVDQLRQQLKDSVPFSVASAWELSNRQLRERLADYEKILSGKYGDLFATAQKLQSRDSALRQRVEELEKQKNTAYCEVEVQLRKLGAITADAGWTTELPKVPGWYWLRYPHDKLQRLFAVRVYDGVLEPDGILRVLQDGVLRSIDELLIFEWSGPLVPPGSDNGWAETTNELRRRLAEREEELTQWRAVGITEELLRKQDGFLKLGKGCCIVIEQQWNEMAGKLVQLEKQKETLTRCYLSTMDLLQQADRDMHIQRATAIEALSSKRRDVFIEISERFASGGSGLDILQWCREQAERSKP